ncbi:MAG: hypothetical protein ACU0DE_03070 [Paracoccus sp. (in: a-proteobacteria)]|uniref:hypothetical protein n=1 Tax=Paracoccus sp. TaxID=267 RepID=UPI00405934D8
MNDTTKFDTESATLADAGSRRRARSRPRGIWARLLTGFLDRAITQGTLTLFLPDGSRHRSGGGMPKVAARITTRKALRRIALDPDLALGEA